MTERVLVRADSLQPFVQPPINLGPKTWEVGVGEEGEAGEILQR